MTEDEKDTLLIRLDERTRVMADKMEKFEKIVDIVKSHASDIKVIKWVGTTAVSVGGLFVGALEYFKK